MNIEATAEALAPDTAQPVDAPVENEGSEDSELSAIFQKGRETDQTEEQPEPVEDAIQEETTEDGPEEAPSDVPHQIKQHWKDIPKAARDAVLESQREIGRRLSEQGRQIQGISPIRDVLVQATKELPGLSQMTPQDAAKQIFDLAKVSSDFNAKPVETVLGLIQKHNMGEAVRQALSGQQVTSQAPQLMQHIQQLQREIQRLSDPNTLRQTFSSFNAEAQVESSVTEFAKTAEHWGAVEDHMPAAVQYVKATLPEGTSPQDVLKKAYELAVSQFVPNAKATQEDPAAKAVSVVDPERSKAAIKAKSANVKSSSESKPREMTEDEILKQAYRKAQS